MLDNEYGPPLPIQKAQQYTRATGAKLLYTIALLRKWLPIVLVRNNDCGH